LLSRLEALTFLLRAGRGAAVHLVSISGNVAVQRLVVTTLEGNADSSSAKETVVGANGILSHATIATGGASRGGTAVVLLARVLEVADNIIGGVRAVTSSRFASIISAANGIIADLLRSLASTRGRVANSRNAKVR